MKIIKKVGKIKANDGKWEAPGCSWEMGEDPPPSFVLLALILFSFFLPPDLSLGSCFQDDSELPGL